MGSRLAPSFNPDSNTVTIPRNSWGVYSINGEKVKGNVVIDEETTVKVVPKPPARFRDGIETEWTFVPGVSAEPTQLPVVDNDAATQPDSTE